MSGLNTGTKTVLAEAGMIPMSEEEREQYADAIENLPALTADMLK